MTGDNNHICRTYNARIISKEFLLNKQKTIMDTFNLNDEEFSLLLYYFDNEPPLDDKCDEPVKVLQNIDKEAHKSNIIVVSDRFCCGLEYARIGGFDLK